MEADPQDWPREDLARRLWEGWRVDGGSLVEVRTGANNVYRGTREGAPVFVKVTAGTIRPESDIEGSTAFLHHLGEKGVPVSRLILTEDGERYQIMPHQDRRYYIVVAEAARGEGIDEKCKSPNLFAAWGEAMARLHSASEAFDPSPYKYITGDGEWERIPGRSGDAPDAIRAQIDRIAAWRAGLPRPSEGFCLIHADMNAGNVIFDGAKATLIDFDEPMLTWSAADIARPFRETWDHSDAERIAQFDAMMSAYLAIREPDFSEPQDIENFCTLKNLEMYGWFEKFWEGDEAYGHRTSWIKDKLTDLILNPLRLE